MERANETSVVQEDFVTRTKDGIELTGTIYRPALGIPLKAVVQLNPATAAERSYYVPFATYLAESGYAVGVWDYRGSGPSANKPPRDLAYRFADYGLQDMPAILSELESRFPDLPKLIVGHSVGGQQVGLMSNANSIRGLVAVATSVGYFGFMPMTYRMLSFYFFYFFTPLSHRIWGYCAGKRFGYMEDLPTTVVKDWGDWCSRPDYFFDAELYGKSVPRGLYQEFRFPIKVYWVDDDPIANRHSVPKFWSHVKSAAGIEIQPLRRRDFGVRHFGHFGFFRRRFRDTFWSQIRQDLDRFLAT